MPGAQDAISEKALAFKITSADQLYHTIDDGRYTRKIYKRDDLNVEEHNLMDEFKAYIKTFKDEHQELLTWAFDEHNFALRFLSSYQYDFEKSLKQLTKVQDWLRDELPARLANLEKWRPYLEDGVIYAHGRDKQMRPILHVNIKKLGNIGIDNDSLLGLIDYVYSYLTFNAMVPGSIEQCIVIYDCADMSLSDIPVSAIRAMVTHGTYAWKTRNTKAFFINLPWLARAGFNMFQTFLDQFQQTSNIALGATYLVEFDSVIGLDNLQQIYGGSRATVQKADFFPFDLN